MAILHRKHRARPIRGSRHPIQGPPATPTSDPNRLRRPSSAPSVRNLTGVHVRSGSVSCGAYRMPSGPPTAFSRPAQQHKRDADHERWRMTHSHCLPRVMRFSNRHIVDAMQKIHLLEGLHEKRKNSISRWLLGSALPKKPSSHSIQHQKLVLSESCNCRAGSEELARPNSGDVKTPT